MIEEILSVGIDIGTTTTSLVLSRLQIDNIAAGFVVPKIKIIGRKIIYRSPVYFTPLLDIDVIDFDKLVGIVRSEYEKALVKAEEVRTGAIIITGETAKKKNAEMVARALSSLAGTFVVAIAGPHLEAYLAGIGSGAAHFSRDRNKTICNIDIGGGTTNAAIFVNGKLKSTFCANIGSRVIKFKEYSQEVVSWTEIGWAVCEDLGISIKQGIYLSIFDIRRIAKRLASALLNIIVGESDPIAAKAAIGELPRDGVKADSFMFSGGVGRLFYDVNNSLDSELLKYGDLGPFLANELRLLLVNFPLDVIKPYETIYATVIGAGVHTTELSGSTIFYTSSDILPLVNVPVVTLDSLFDDIESIKKELVGKFFTFTTVEGHSILAIAIPKGVVRRFEDLNKIATAIALAYKSIGVRIPVVILCEDDIGKAMGVVLKDILGSGWNIVVVDEISLGEGDYVDIGKPLYGGAVIPVVMKTLVFQHK
ncbi:MAG: ethanolamine ammonia-lyase reactivating factor EutA [Synergistetes bacterium]|nr:ethanolamine ammonia-lyase reactivating factor EutA [Synergistota bacterium]MCX8127747.1 ethanolamine ammonia-lyase reactivating factor EutA [Synergistota bacterium]MDW8191338.1 ethanolamine ammonia-lyase reactivating factor EutA [Synergistota bacterium]